MKQGEFTVDKCAKAFKKWQDENGSAYKWFMYLPRGPIFKYNECVALKIKDQCNGFQPPGIKKMQKYVTLPGGISQFRNIFGLGGGEIIEKNDKKIQKNNKQIQTGGIYGFVSRSLNLADKKIPLPQYVTYKLHDEYDS